MNINIIKKHTFLTCATELDLTYSRFKSGLYRSHKLIFGENLKKKKLHMYIYKQ